MRYSINLDLTKEQVKELKIKAIREEKTVRQLIRELIINKLEEKYGHR